jgi:hypothetical protein
VILFSGNITLATGTQNMTETWTVERILALAPDAASAKAGQSLAGARKWVATGCDARVVWGECQGSGATPYQTQIDLMEPAFRCSCPSCKFPCKHGLGLLLLFVATPSAVPETTPPAWVTDWLSKRDEKAQKREPAADIGKTEAELAKAAAQQTKRVAGRQAKVTQGLQDLDLWLCDLVRQGLAALPAKPYKFWDEAAARLVDAQAPGVARMLRGMAGIPNSGEGWMDRLMERLGLLYLLLEGAQRLDTGALSEAEQADIRSVIGFTVRQEEVLAGVGVSDRWLNIGQHIYDEDQLRVHRTWLWGEGSGQAALLLDFVRPGQQPERLLAPGVAFAAELVYFPSALPQRALIRELQPGLWAIGDAPGYATGAALLAAYADALAKHPWLEAFPAPLKQVVPVQSGERWALRDRDGNRLPLSAQFAQEWRLMAVSGGRPITVMGEWDGAALLPLSAWADRRFVRL